MQKAKSRPTVKFKSDTARARHVMSRVGLLSIKSIIFSIRYAMNEAPSIFTKNQECMAKDMRRLSRRLTTLESMAGKHYKDEKIEPSRMYGVMKTSITAYVSIFYDANASELDMYIAKCKASGVGRKLRSEQNMLLIPAIMASKGRPKSAVISALLSGVYKKSFQALYDSSKASLHMEFFKRSLAITNATDQSLEGFSQTLDRMSLLLNGIDAYDIHPEEDDAKKEQFMEQLLKLNDETGVDALSLLEERLMPYEAVNKRIMRK